MVFVDNFEGMSKSYGFAFAGSHGLQSFPRIVLDLDLRDGLMKLTPLGNK
jgi:hypothetical protein